MKPPGGWMQYAKEAARKEKLEQTLTHGSNGNMFIVMSTVMRCLEQIDANIPAAPRSLARTPPRTPGSQRPALLTASHPIALSLTLHPTLAYKPQSTSCVGLRPLRSPDPLSTAPLPTPMRTRQPDR